MFKLVFCEAGAFRVMFKKTRQIILTICVASVLTLAAFFGGLRLFLPVVTAQRTEIEILAQKLLKHPVYIHGIQVRWDGFTPTITFHDVTIMTVRRRIPILQADEISAQVSVWQSLKAREFILKQLLISGTELHIAQKANGQIILIGFARRQDQANSWQQFVQWLWREDAVTLQQIRVIWQPEVGAAWLAEQAVITLKNYGTLHEITLDTDISPLSEPESEAPMHASLWLDGSDLAAPSTQMHLYVTTFDVPLAKWQTLLPASWPAFTKGTGDMSVFGAWRNGSWNSWQTDVGAKNTEIDWPAQQLQLGFKRLIIEWDGFKPVQGAWMQEGSLAMHNVSLNASRLFDAPLLFNQARTELNLRTNQNNQSLLQIKSASLRNDILNIATSGEISWQPKQSPHLNLMTKIQITKPNRMAPYFPNKKMRPKFVEWLAQAFLPGGQIQGTVQVEGQASQFPGTAINPVLKGLFTAHDINLSYHAGWLPITMLQGQMQLLGVQLAMQFTHGLLAGSILKKGSASIQDIRPSQHPHLLVSGTLQGLLQQGVAYLAQSPLKQLAHTLTELNPKGPMQLHLQLTAPLYPTPTPEIAIKGQVQLQKTELQYQKWLPLHLTGVQGLINFTNKNLMTKDVTGELMGFPATISVTSEEIVPKIWRTKVTGNSQISADSLRQYLPIAWLPMFSGVSHYHIRAILQPKEPVRITANSSLQGMTIPWPSPFGKKTTTAVPLIVHYQLSHVMPNQSQWLALMVQYGHTVAAQLQFKRTHTKDIASPWDWYAGNIVFGGSTAKIPTKPGIEISGVLSQLDWPAWMAVLKQRTHPTVISRDDSLNQKIETVQLQNLLARVRRIHLTINQIHIFSLLWDQVTVYSTPIQDGWHLQFAGPQIIGTSTYVVHNTGSKLVLDLQKLYLKTVPNNTATSPPQVKDFPSIDAKIADLHINKANLGAVNLAANVVGNIMTVPYFNIIAPHFSLNATGQWQQITAKTSKSIAKGTVISHDVAGMLADFDLPPWISAKFGEINFELSWPDALMTPIVRDFTGPVTATLKNGRIKHLSSTTQAKIGLGQLINIFSLATIPKRLQLDFNDLIPQGLSFDTLQAQILFGNAQAKITHATLKGLVASVTTHGIISLQSRGQYDFDIEVTPYLTSSLPVIAVIAGGPLIGAVTWVANKVLLAPLLDHLMTYSYHVHGLLWDRN